MAEIIKEELIKNNKIKIGNITLENNILIAPIAGVTDKAFREVLNKYAKPGLIYTEMVSAKAITMKDKKTYSMLGGYEDEKIKAVQIFGSEPEVMKQAAMILKNYADILDINMGCPVPKVAKTGGGAKLLQNINLAREIVRKVRSVWEKPLTVKIRIGWDDKDIVAEDFVNMLCKEGVDAISIHGRVAEKYYSGDVNFEVLKKCKQISTKPIIVNGGIFTSQDAFEILEKTGADGIMLARGTFGNVLGVTNIVKSVSAGKVVEKDYTKLDNLKILKEQYELACKYDGEEKASKEIRKQIIWYSKGINNSAVIRKNVSKVVDKKTFDEIYEKLYELNLLNV